MGGVGSGRHKETVEERCKRIIKSVTTFYGPVCRWCHEGSWENKKLYVVWLYGMLDVIQPKMCFYLCRSCIAIWNARHWHHLQAVIIQPDGYYVAEELELKIKKGKITNELKQIARRTQHQFDS